MYLDFLLFTCILHVSQSAKESKVHLRYTSDTSKYMYLMRFLDVTLDTYQDTSRYMYLGRVMTTLQESRYNQEHKG